MSRTTFKHADADSVFHEMRRRMRRDYRILSPGPNDLTADIIAQRMSVIHVGDQITFDSQKEAYTTAQVDRHSSTIKATAPVAEHCGGYVMVRLHNGVLESVNYFSIEAVNGRKWPYYVDPYTTSNILPVEESALW